MVKNGEMVKNGDLNFKIFSQKYFISSLEYISMIVYTNVENHLFSSLLITLHRWRRLLSVATIQKFWVFENFRVDFVSSSF